MPRNRKHFIHGSVVELCFRAESGLVMPATPLMREVLLGILARAQHLYPVTICHYVVMANHMHLLIVVQDPANVPRFMEYLKRESAHAINRLIGRKRHTVWHAEYDSPVILDAEKVISRIIYFLTNPQRAGLVRRMDEYPHLSSWNALLGDGEERQVRYYPRSAIRKELSEKEMQSDRTLKELRKRSSREYTLRITPNAWLSCFEASREAAPSDVRREILKRVREAEVELATQFKKVRGAQALSSARISLEYASTKHGKRMICLASTKILRVQFIAWFREVTAEAARSIQSWMQGVRNPVCPGFFCPGGMLHAYINPLFTPLALV